MAARSELLDHLVDQLAPLGEARDARCSAATASIRRPHHRPHRLRHVLSEGGRPEPTRFRAAGASPFSYDTKMRHTSTAYWEVPADVLDDPTSCALGAEVAGSLAAGGAKSREKAGKFHRRDAERKALEQYRCDGNRAPTSTVIPAQAGNP